MARSLSQSVEMNAEIVKTVRMVLTSHPLFTVANLIFQIIINLLDYLSIKGANNLRDRIVKMMSYLWESLKRYCQKSIILMALQDAIAEKMKTPSEALKKQLAKEAVKDYPKVRLIGKYAMHSAIFLLKDTEFFSTYDKEGSKMCLIFLCLLLCLLLPTDLTPYRFGVLRKRDGWKVNAISNFTCFILALVFEKFYEKSWRSLSAGFCIVVYFLSILVIARPLIDFGFFGLIIGVILSVAYNCYGFKVQMWVMACICFMLFSFKSWLDKYWLDLEHTLLPSTTDNIGTAGMILSAPTSIVWAVTSLCMSRFVDDLRDHLGDNELDHEGLFLSDVTYFVIALVIKFSTYFYLWYWVFKLYMREAVQAIARNHLPFSPGIKLSTRQAIRWSKFSVLLDILFILLEITSCMTLEEGLPLIGFLSVIVLLRLHSLKFPTSLFERSLYPHLFFFY